MDNIHDIITEHVIKKAAAGDDKAFETLYNSVSGKMYSLCLRYAGNNEDANDFFQEGTIKMYRSLHTFRHDGSFEGWARRIYVTTSLDILKKNKLKTVKLEDSFDLPSKYTDASDKLQMDNLIAVIQLLSPLQRMVLNLSLIEDYSHREIGALLKIEETVSKSTLYRAKIKLKELLKQTNFIDKDK
jgi:RNA polymerase sigma factor (sigma-70 family)